MREDQKASRNVNSPAKTDKTSPKYLGSVWVYTNKSFSSLLVRIIISSGDLSNDL